MRGYGHGPKPLPFHYVLYLVPVICFLVHTGSASLFFTDGTEVASDQIAGIISGIPAHRFPAEQPGTITEVSFFYDHECHSCQDSLIYLRDYARKNPQVNISFLNLAVDTMNQHRFNRYLDRFNTTKVAYPVVFLGDIALTESSDIINFIDPILRQAGLDE